MKNFIYLFIVVLLSLNILSCSEKSNPSLPDDENDYNYNRKVQIISPLDYSFIGEGDSLDIITKTEASELDQITVMIFKNGILEGSSDSTYFKQTVYNLPLGETKFIAKGLYESINITKSDTITVIGISDPVISFPDFENHYFLDDTLSINVNAISINGPIQFIEFTFGDSFIQRDSIQPFIFNPIATQLGSINIKAVAVDSLNAIGSKKTSIYIVENTRPQFSFGSFYGSTRYLGEPIDFSYNSYDQYNDINRIEIYDGDSLIFISDKRSGEFSYAPDSPGDKLIYGFAYDNSNQRSEPDSISLNVIPSISLGNIIISDLFYSSNDTIIYGLDKTNGKLLLIDIQNYKIEKEIDLPFSQPLAMQFSTKDRKCYIVSKYSGDITVFDEETGLIETWPFSDTHDGLDIEIDKNLRRIFVLADMNVGFIMNLDDGSVLESSTLSAGSSLEYSPNHKKLFVNDHTIVRYNIINDKFEEEQSVWGYANNPRKLAIHPSGDIICLPAGGGNGSGYTVFAIDTKNMENVFGEWYIGTYPKFVHFTRSGDILFGTNGSPYDPDVYVMRVADYSEITTLGAPEVEDYGIIETNLSETRVVIYSYGTYGRIFIYDITDFE